MENVLSDGEISNDSDNNDRYSVISSGEDEYFKSLTNEIKTRQAELELENVLIRYVDDYAKENKLEHTRSMHRSKKSITIKPKRSFRASSVLSNYSLPRRKRSNRSQYKKRPLRYDSKKQNRELINQKISSDHDDDEDEDEDCELIRLRLNALKSKQELKEPEIKQKDIIEKESSLEEELLRIDALKSALIKKKDHFMEKKRKRKLEKERPYSPTDDLDKILEDEPMELSHSPVQSPQDDINQMDMEISDSNSPTPNNIQNENEANLSDMDLTNSPVYNANDAMNDDDEEKTLRLMLLSSINNRRKAEERTVALNLKLAVERLRQAQLKQSPSSPPPIKIQNPKKSGTKTIKMILEEKKNRRTFEDQTENENYLLNKITFEQNEVIQKLPTPVIEKVVTAENDNLLPTISDTKNIPLLSNEEDNRKSRVLTTLIKKPVEPLIISVNGESSEDDYDIQDRTTIKRPPRTVVRVGIAKTHQINMIEKQVENILRKIRLQSEKGGIPTVFKKNTPQPINVEANTTSPEIKNEINSAVGHLPKSAQIEYAMLMEKMKMLEETKATRQKSRQILRRQKSVSKNEIDSIMRQEVNTIKETQGNQVNIDIRKSKKSLASEKIEETLGKVQLLDEAARERFTSNAENKYLAHSTSLLNTSEDLLKLLSANCVEIKRRDKVEAKIGELERQIIKLRSLKKIVDHRINVGIPQIVRSQNALVKLRNHQHNYGKMCSRVGEIVRGSNYSLPDGHTQMIQANMSTIVTKCEEIQNSCSDHFAIKHLKVNSQKINLFLSNSNTSELCGKQDALFSESNILLSGKRNLTENENTSLMKKIKYESPLAFQRTENTCEENVNNIVCPKSLEDINCNDINCKMLHI